MLKEWAQNRRWFFPLLGLLIVIAYWFSVRPQTMGRTYTEDWCHAEMTRQMMAESLTQKGRPTFHTDKYGAPNGESVAYMSWGIEHSGLGALVFLITRDFPFSWAHFGLSLLIAYLGVAIILRRMKLSPAAAWLLSALVVTFHVPRHFKIWHHYEHLIQHWMYLSLFFDAWIWQRFMREKRWSLHLEAWRGFFLITMLTTAGYFWGPLIMEWTIVRALMISIVLFNRFKKRDLLLTVETNYRGIIAPALLGALWLSIEIPWFLELKKEADQLGHVDQGLGWFTPIQHYLRPLWANSVYEVFRRGMNLRWQMPAIQYSSETLVSVGWFYWIPMILAVRAAGQKTRRLGLKLIAPFALLLIIGILYGCVEPPILQEFLRAYVPFMAFFRVASRWGLFMPQLIVIMMVLCWPEFQAWAKEVWARRTPRTFKWIALFITLTVLEFSVMLTPVSTLPDMPAQTVQLLEDIHKAPGTSVLDLPFCHAGGNNMCTEQQCPNYPTSTVGGCLRLWHDKSVYGIYQSRLVWGHCDAYNRAPYLGWFDAWREQRCFSNQDWKDFCQHLDQHPELSAVLVYPDIWVGAGTPECLAQFEAHLGQPMAQGLFTMDAVRGNQVPRQGRLMRYGTKCLK